MTESCGRLPPSDEMEQQLHTAGFVSVQRRRLLLGAKVLAFTAAS
jgi:hypothetical protein